MAFRDREAPLANRDAGSAATLERASLELHAGDSAAPANGANGTGDAAAVTAAQAAAKQPLSFGFEMDYANQLATFTARGMFDVLPQTVSVPFAAVEMAFHQMLTAKLAPVYQTALAPAGAPVPSGNPFGRPF
jgi:hypothetical protein